MKIKLLLCLSAAVAARAANYVGDQVFAAPFNMNENVNVVGNLTFANPGTYSATHWNIVGLVRFGAPGEYVVVATTGGFSASGNVLGPTNGLVSVRVSYRTTINFVGTVASSVTVVDDSATPPGSPPPETVVSPPPAPLMNLSTRVALGAGATLNPGFVIGGSAPRRVLIRAIGPGLAAFGVASALTNPTLAVFRGAMQVGANDDWGGEAATQATFSAVGAFGLAASSRDAVLVLTLQPGAYTALVRGATATDTGDVLFEVYYVE